MGDHIRHPALTLHSEYRASGLSDRDPPSQGMPASLHGLPPRRGPPKLRPEKA